MVRINRPAVIANGCIKASALNGLNITRVTGPAYTSEVVQVKKQLKVSLVRLEVMHHR
jgi:hypothetical protein